MDSQTLILILCVAAAVGIAWFFYQEQQARLLRTRVVELPGCLRFEAHGFHVEIHTSAKQLKVHAESGQLTQTPLAGGTRLEQAGPVDATLPAAGLQVDVARVSTKAQGQATPVPSGLCTITFTATDALNNAVAKQTGGHASVLIIDQVREPVASSFQGFANRVQLWADKITHRLEQERAEQQRKEEELARAALEKQRLAEAGEEAVDGDFTAQIARWRKAAGFSGNYSDVSTDAKGQVVWFIDLCDDGRITLHADKRTVHSTLLGASIRSLGAELEIGVRDDYWSEEDPTLPTFRVLQGMPPGERQAWLDRLEKLRDALNIKVQRGY